MVAVMSSDDALARLVVFVPKRVDGDVSVHNAVTSKLTSLGARLGSRYGKDVTHIVYLKKLLPSPQEQARQEATLRDLYEKINKADRPQHIVSNLWVQASADLGFPAKEEEYRVAPPPDPERSAYYAVSPPQAKAGSRRAAASRRKSSAVPLPTDAFAAFDIDSFMFSSSQQIREHDTHGPGPEAAGAAGAPAAGQAKRARSVSAGPRKKRSAASAANAAVHDRVVSITKAQRTPRASPKSAPAGAAPAAKNVSNPDMPPPPQPGAAKREAAGTARTPAASAPATAPSPRAARTPAAAKTPASQVKRLGAATPSSAARVDEEADAELPARGAATEPRPLRVRGGVLLPAAELLQAPATEARQPRKSSKKSVAWAENLTPNVSPTGIDSVKRAASPASAADAGVGLLLHAHGGLAGAITPAAVKASGKTAVAGPPRAPGESAQGSVMRPEASTLLGTEVTDGGAGSVPGTTVKVGSVLKGVDGRQVTSAPTSAAKQPLASTTDGARMLLARRQSTRALDTPGLGAASAVTPGLTPATGLRAVPKLKAAGSNELPSLNPSLATTPSVIDLTLTSPTQDAGVEAQVAANAAAGPSVGFTFMGPAAAAAPSSRRGTRSGGSTPKLLAKTPLKAAAAAAVPTEQPQPVTAAVTVTQAEEQEQEQRPRRSARNPSPLPAAMSQPEPSPKRMTRSKTTPAKAGAAGCPEAGTASAKEDGAAEPGPSSAALAAVQPPRSTRKRAAQAALAVEEAGAGSGPHPSARHLRRSLRGVSPSPLEPSLPAPGAEVATAAHGSGQQPLLQQAEPGSPPRSTSVAASPIATPPSVSAARTSQLPAGTPLRTPSYYTRLQRRRFTELGVELQELQPGCSYSVAEDGSLLMDGQGAELFEAAQVLRGAQQQRQVLDPTEVTSAAPSVVPSAASTPTRGRARGGTSAAPSGAPSAAVPLPPSAARGAASRGGTSGAESAIPSAAPSAAPTPSRARTRSAALLTEVAADVSNDQLTASANDVAVPAGMDDTTAAEAEPEPQFEATQDAKPVVQQGGSAAPTPASARMRGRAVTSRYLTSARAPSSSKRAQANSSQKSPSHSQQPLGGSSMSALRASQQPGSGRVQLRTKPSSSAAAGGSTLAAGHTTLTVAPGSLCVIEEAGEHGPCASVQQAGGVRGRSVSPARQGSPGRATAGTKRTAQGTANSPGPAKKGEEGAAKARKAASGSGAAEQKVRGVAAGTSTAAAVVEAAPATSHASTRAVSGVAAGGGASSKPQPQAGGPLLKHWKQTSLLHLVAADKERKRTAAATGGKAADNEAVSNSFVAAGAPGIAAGPPAPKRVRRDTSASSLQHAGLQQQQQQQRQQPASSALHNVAASTTSLISGETSGGAVAAQAASRQARPEAVAGEQRQATQKHNLACTSVDTTVLAAVQAAVKQLGGARMCVEGYEEGRVTHLIMGAERRTLKVLLAIANGAHLVTPAWVTASVAAGKWLPESSFAAGARFAETSAAVRASAAQAPRPPRPLEGRDVCVHCTAPGGTGPAATKAAEHKAGLQRLVLALGGKVVPVRACNLCVLAGGAPLPRSLPKAVVAVGEEWLFKVAETHTMADTKAFDMRKAV